MSKWFRYSFLLTKVIENYKQKLNFFFFEEAMLVIKEDAYLLYAILKTIWYSYIGSLPNQWIKKNMALKCTMHCFPDSKLEELTRNWIVSLYIMGSFKILNLQFPIFCMLEIADTRIFCSRTDFAWEFTFWAYCKFYWNYWEASWASWVDSIQCCGWNTRWHRNCSTYMGWAKDLQCSHFSILAAGNAALCRSLNMLKQLEAVYRIFFCFYFLLAPGVREHKISTPTSVRRNI